MNPLIEHVLRLYKKTNDAIYFSERIADINQAAYENRKAIIYKFQLHLAIRKLEDVYKESNNEEYLDILEYVKN